MLNLFDDYKNLSRDSLTISQLIFLLSIRQRHAKRKDVARERGCALEFDL